MAQAPKYFLEVDMPIAAEEVAGTDWSRAVESKELCLLLCAPLQNPLNNRTVGPDYNRVRALAQLVRWQERKAVFMVQTHDEGIHLGDVATAPHLWKAGVMTEWNPSVTRHWWSLFNMTSDTEPEYLPKIESPRLFHLVAEPSSILVAKAPAEPRLEIPTPDANTPPVPEPPPSIGEAEVRAFLLEHHAKASRGDVAGMVADYDQTVDFLERGLVSQSSIQEEETSHRQKWPKSREEIVGEITLSGNSGTWQASYTIQFHNENASGDWRKGRADLAMIVRLDGQKLCITDQKARVYDLTSGKTNAVAAPPAQPKGVSITVPKPCYVAVMRANDLTQIEITDQIHFIHSGIRWHRTYREFSKDGKVVNTCRAIYEGNVMFATNRRSVYVGSQGWERGLGASAFVKTCEKSARALVGKTYQFQFTTNGMVESATGRRFQIQK